MVELRSLIGKEVVRVFLKVWPPLGGDELREVDLAICLVFSDSPDTMLEIGTNVSHQWGIVIFEYDIPSFTYSWSEYETRMKEWIVSDEKRNMEVEYFDVSSEDLFKGLLGRIQRVETIDIDDDNPNPFGAKIAFLDDYIMQFPIASGGTVETKRFNRWGLLENYKHLGDIRFVPVADV